MPSLAQKLLLLMSGASASPAELVDAYITDTIAPMLYYKFNETSGDLIDYGSEGADGTVSGATQSETGQLGEGEAYLFDGVDDVITVLLANIPNVSALTTQRWAFLLNPTSQGESSAGIIAGYNSSRTYFVFSGTAALRVQIYTNATLGVAIANNGQIADCIGNWCWLFWDYDNADALGNGRKARIWKGINGTLTPLTLATDQAATGTAEPQIHNFHIGNRAALDFTFDGLFDVAIVDSGLWTSEEMQQLIDLSGV